MIWVAGASNKQDRGEPGHEGGGTEAAQGRAPLLPPAHEGCGALCPLLSLVIPEKEEEACSEAPIYRAQKISVQSSQNWAHPRVTCHVKWPHVFLDD